jgi:hypothetical protein
MGEQDEQTGVKDEGKQARSPEPAAAPPRPDDAENAARRVHHEQKETD